MLGGGAGESSGWESGVVGGGGGGDGLGGHGFRRSAYFVRGWDFLGDGGLDDGLLGDGGLDDGFLGDGFLGDGFGGDGFGGYCLRVPSLAVGVRIGHSGHYRFGLRSNRRFGVRRGA